MHERILKQMRQKIRTRDYVVSLHAADEMEEDGYTILDVEAGILGGTIVERQRDGETGETGESKYRVRGPAAAPGEIEEVAKLGPTGKLVIITVYRP